MAETTEVEIVLIVDENGDYVVSNDDDDAHDRAGDASLEGAWRKIRITLTVPLPEIIEVAATLPQNEQGEYSLEIKPTA